MATKNTAYLDIPLREAQRAFSMQSDGVEAIKTTIRTVFSASSLIVSLVAALQLVTANVAPEWLTVYQWLIVVIAVLYLLLIVMCVLGMSPVNYNLPIEMEWDVLTMAFQNLNEHDTLTKYLSSILNVIDLNRLIVARLLRIERAVLILLPIIVLLILALAWLPRV